MIDLEFSNVYLRLTVRDIVWQAWHDVATNFMVS